MKCSSLAWRVRPKHYMADGVNSVKYDRVIVEKRAEYTWVYISLPEPPANFKGYQRASNAAVTVRLSVMSALIAAMSSMAVLSA